MSVIKEVAYEKKHKKISIGKIYGLTDLRHMHKEIEIVYVKKGKAVAYADTCRCEISDGDIFIAFPNQVHFYDNITDDKNSEYYLLIISYDILEGIKSILRNNVPVNNSISFKDCEYGKQLIEKIMEIRYGSQIKYPEIKLIGYTCLLMTEILPLMELQPCANTNNSTLRSILDYCDTHYNEHLTLDDAANALHLSKYYISRLMNDKIKFGFNDYLNTLRVNYACELLSVTDMHISYISEISGFGTIRTFNRVFQSIKHISPLEYRKQNFKPKKNDAENKTDVGDF